MDMATKVLLILLDKEMPVIGHGSTILCETIYLYSLCHHISEAFEYLINGPFSLTLRLIGTHTFKVSRPQVVVYSSKSTREVHT